MDSHDDMQARRGAMRTLMLMLPFWDVEFDLDSTLNYNLEVKIWASGPALSPGRTQAQPYID